MKKLYAVTVEAEIYVYADEPPKARDYWFQDALADLVRDQVFSLDATEVTKNVIGDELHCLVATPTGDPRMTLGEALEAVNSGK